MIYKASIVLAGTAIALISLAVLGWFTFGMFAGMYQAVASGDWLWLGWVLVPIIVLWAIAMGYSVASAGGVGRWWRGWFSASED